MGTDRNFNFGKQDGGSEFNCQICKKRGHTTLNCWHHYNQLYQPDIPVQALAAMTITDINNDAWHPDTGASSHMTADAGKLFNLTKYDGHDKIMVGNGSTLDITHIGSAAINTGDKSLFLDNILVVPEIKKNLLSVGQLTTENPYTCKFSSDKFVIKDRRTKHVIAVGSRCGGLYALQPANGAALFSTRFRVASDRIWHERFGHPRMLVIDLLKKKSLISSTNNTNKAEHFCNSC